MAHRTADPHQAAAAPLAEAQEPAATAVELARDLPALAASLVLHVVVLLWLALSVVAVPGPSRPPVTVIETAVDEPEIDLAPEEMIVSDTAEETGAEIGRAHV